MLINVLLCILAGVLLLMGRLVLHGQKVKRIMRGRLSADTRLEHADTVAERRILDSSTEHHLWAVNNGFEYVGAFRLVSPDNPETTTVAWENCSLATTLVRSGYRATMFTDFVTDYDDGSILVTGSSPIALIGPVRSNFFRQAFERQTLEQQWNRHEEGDVFLREKLPLELEDNLPPFDQRCLKSLREHAALWLSIRFLGFRTLHWANRANRMVNVPISSQSLKPFPLEQAEE